MSGCVLRYAYSEVVPAFCAPITRKSGSTRWAARNDRARCSAARAARRRPAREGTDTIADPLHIDTHNSTATYRLLTLRASGAGRCAVSLGPRNREVRRVEVGTFLRAT